MANDNQQEVIKDGHRQEENTKKRIINYINVKQLENIKYLEIVLTQGKKFGSEIRNHIGLAK